MSVADWFSPGDLAFIGTLGAVALALFALRCGDWLPRPNPGDLPYRWGRVAFSIREARGDVLAWIFATLGSVVGMTILLFIHGSMWSG